MDLTRLTGLWKNKDKKGQVYLSGSLNSITQIMVLPNTFKEEGDSKAPDYHMYITPKDKSEGKGKHTLSLDKEDL